jgi:hypothetical protein
VDYASDGFLVGSLRDRVGQLGESGEYRMRRSEFSVFIFRAPKVVAPPLVLIKDRIGWALLQQALLMY